MLRSEELNSRTLCPPPSLQMINFDERQKKKNHKLLRPSSMWKGAFVAATALASDGTGLTATLADYDVLSDIITIHHRWRCRLRLSVRRILHWPAPHGGCQMSLIRCFMVEKLFDDQVPDRFLHNVMRSSDDDSRRTISRKRTRTDRTEQTVCRSLFQWEKQDGKELLTS